MRRIGIILGIVILLGSGCSKAKTTTNGEMAGGSASVTLKEYQVSVDPASSKAGTVKFTAQNMGTIPHELVVIKTDLDQGALPVKEGAVDEQGAGVKAAGEIEEFEAGKTQSASFELTAGKYVLICNVAGHYQLGMHTAFRVS